MKTLLIVLLVCAHVSSPSAQTIDDLTFVTEHYPPLNYIEGGELKGIAVEALGEMFKLTGSNNTLEDVKLWPWARGYNRVLHTRNTVLFSTARTEARETLFKWVGPIIPSRVVIVAKKSRHVRIDSAKDLDGYRIGTVRDDIGEQLLLERGVDKGVLQPTISGLNTAKMLEKDRVDMWAYEEIIAFWNLRIIGGNPDDYEVVYTLKESQYYFALHKETVGTVVEALQSALNRIKAEGKFQKIVDSYSRKGNMEKVQEDDGK